MGNDRRDRTSQRVTIPTIKLIVGNDLFERVIRAIKLDDTTSRPIVAETLLAVGSGPGMATIEEIGALLPEVDRKLRMALPTDVAEGAMARLRHLVLSWEGT